MTTPGGNDFDDGLPNESAPLPPDEGGDEGEGEEEEGATKTTPAPPPPAVRRTRAKKKAPGHGDRRRGPPPNGPRVGREAAEDIRRSEGRPPPGVGSFVADRAHASVVRGESSIDPTQEQTLDVMERWPLVVQKLAEEGLGPEAVSLRVTCVAEGPFAAEPQLLGTIDGRRVAGGAEVSPAEALHDFIAQVYHRTTQVAAKYTIDIFYKVSPHWRSKGGTSICRAYLSLPHYTVIMQQRAAVEDFSRRNPPSAGFGAVPSALPPPLPGMPHVVGPSTPGGPTFVLPPSPSGAGANSATEEMMRTMFLEMWQRMMSGLGQPAAAPPPMPAPVIQMPPAPEAPKPPTLKEQLADLVTVVKALREIDPPQAPAQQPVAQTIGKPVKPETPASAFAGIRETLRAARELQEEIAEMTGAVPTGDEEPAARKPDEPPFKVSDLAGIKWPHGEGLGRLDQFQNFLMMNPDLTAKGIQTVIGALDKSIVGQFLQYVMTRGSAPQQQAAQQAVTGMARSPSTVPPAMPPVVRPPQVNGAPQPETFVPPVIPEWRPPA